jgi:hypothetical protein
VISPGRRSETDRRTVLLEVNIEDSGGGAETM